MHNIKAAPHQKAIAPTNTSIATKIAVRPKKVTKSLVHQGNLLILIVGLV